MIIKLKHFTFMAWATLVSLSINVFRSNLVADLILLPSFAVVLLVLLIRGLP